MDDLSGLDWSKPTGSQPKQPSMSIPTNSSYPTLRPTPPPAGSGRTTPSSASQAPGASSSLSKSAAKPAQDSFSNLMNFGPAKAKQNLSLAERQAQLEAEKKRKEEERKKQAEAQFGSAQQWDALGSRAFTPSPSIPPPAVSNGATNDDDDLFAAFNKDTKVDNSSHYPPPAPLRLTPVEEKKKLDLNNPSAWGASSISTDINNDANAGGFDDDDDPFGLNDLKPSGQSAAPEQATAGDDDDFLGDLGKPVEEVRMKQQQRQQQPEPGKPIEDDDAGSSEDDCSRPRRQQQEARGDAGVSTAFDRAVAQLVDYGFAPEDARRGLTESGAGLNVQAAANWLLDDAHRKAKEKSQGRSSSTSSGRIASPHERQAGGFSGRGGESDLTKSAAAVGSSLFKTANSLWKSGQKKMQRAVADFQQDGGDPSQPKWMRDAQPGRGHDARHASHDATDEAMALETDGRTRPSRTNSRPAADRRLGLQQSRTSSPSATSSGNQSRNSPAPRWQQTSSPPVSDARSRLNRINTDDDDSFFVSANRRKKPTPAPAGQPKQPDDEPNLLFKTEAPKPSQPSPQRPEQRQTPPSMKQSQGTPLASHRAAPKPARQAPPIGAAALQSSTKHRLEGSAHFKRGDYSMAHSSYSNSISAIPDGHPLMIILLTNRALTAIKTGDTKQAVKDADEALKLIGPENGQGESIAVQGEDGKEETRNMKDLYGKALTRKAEALEQMEKWADALNVWEQCVATGVGGVTATKGRQRCKDIAAPRPKAPPPKPAAKPRPKPSATAALSSGNSSEAVTKLREANAAAAREDDEKFALADKVDARVGAWRDGKRDNLRALIASLDQVLWENSGWKKVGLHELVVANKVKISYMKAIAKTHPDKLPQTASTEARLIAAMVFATLNESWDKFKAENGL
ncbi:auxilin-like clathrin-binding protein required for normal clathrin function [Metarhizium acridum]|nr:auxilin-like clathrin-binding protein required for normal clathrin function [Metarhizium acridum]